MTGLVHLGDRDFIKDEPLGRIVAHTGIPQVFLSGFSAFPHVASICADASTGLLELSFELRRRGVKRIGIISNQDLNKQKDTYFTYAVSLRCAAAQRAFAEQDIETPSHWHILMRKTVLPVDTILQRIAEFPLPDAFWCINDQTAKELIEVLENNNVKVPDDVSVIGYDGVSTELSDNRTLATIQQYNQKLGSIAILKTLEYFDHGINSQNRTVLFPTSFKDGTTLKHKH